MCTLNAAALRQVMACHSNVNAEADASYVGDAPQMLTPMLVLVPMLALKPMLLMPPQDAQAKVAEVAAQAARVRAAKEAEMRPAKELAEALMSRGYRITAPQFRTENR